MIELLSLSVAIFAGLLMTRLMNRWKLPDVTAYLIAGVLIGPGLIGSLHLTGIGFSSFEQLRELSLLSDVALGFIAFSIGNEFRLSQLRGIGGKALVIGVLQAVATALVVDHRRSHRAGCHTDGRAPVQGQGPPDGSAAPHRRAG